MGARAAESGGPLLVSRIFLRTNDITTVRCRPGAAGIPLGVTKARVRAQVRATPLRFLTDGGIRSPADLDRSEVRLVAHACIIVITRNLPRWLVGRSDKPAGEYVLMHPSSRH